MGRRWEPWRWRQWGRGGWWTPWTRPRPHRPGTSVHHEHSVANSLQNFSASPEEKFGRLKEKMRSPVILTFWRNLGPKNTIFVCVSGDISLTSLELERIWGGKTIFIKFGSFSALFCSKSSKIRPQICQAAPLFIRPFLTYAAEQSASWQHWWWK